MKRRVLSFFVALTLCLNLCPAGVLAADQSADSGLCPHHPEHTGGCGYALPVPEQKCAHSHGDGCYITETNCTHSHTAECFSKPAGASEAAGPDLCAHMCTEDSGCIAQTLSCPHEHDGVCGYVPGTSGAPCAFGCSICPIEALIDGLPDSISEYNREQVQAQLSEIFALYDELDSGEQLQVDLSPCVSLLNQLDGMDAAPLDDSAQSSAAVRREYILKKDEYLDVTFKVEDLHLIDTRGFTLYGKNSPAVQVIGTGDLEIKGKVNAQKGVGVDIQSGGSLRVTEPGSDIRGTTSALVIASGAKVQLAAGTYFGKYAAIQTADNNFAALLAPGCAFFDGSGNPILLKNMETAQLVTIGQCPGHPGKTYEHGAGTTKHTWTCPVCGTAKEELCTFDFDQNGKGTCACGKQLTIEVDEDDLANLVYDGTTKPADVEITVTLNDSSNQVLVKGTDYKVDYVPRTDAGEITVTVVGLTYNGTFTRTYQVEQDQPGLSWDTTAKPVPIVLDYDGSSVGTTELPPVKINIKDQNKDLHEFLQYSYQKQGDSIWTSGLPTNAGTYDVKVSLPEMQNFKGAESTPIKLTINKSTPIATAPAATQPVFNRSEQELVTAGALKPAAVIDGVKILFATSQSGPYSETIPMGTSAGNYTVWYKTEGTENCDATSATKVENVLIQRKPLTPIVTLSEYKYLYDGGWKEPKVTVKDDDNKTVLLDTEYAVAYKDNQNVGRATVSVTDKPGGNYDITQVDVTFEITSKTQETLNITQKPATVTYGDKFTLGTSGGSGNGNVTWAIDGAGVATVDTYSGQVVIIGVGSATVKATKSGKDPVTGKVNYEDAFATWQFTAVEKPVTATVTAEDKTYDGDDTATVRAVVEEGVLPGDQIIITGLTGAFDNKNAGTDKTVNVNVGGAAVSGHNSEYYSISYSATTVKAAIRKATAQITTAPVPASVPYDGTPQPLIATDAVVDPASVPVEYALSEGGPYSTAFPTGVNAGSYTVWYRVQETENYTGPAPAKVDAVIQKKKVTPQITLNQDIFVYDGTAHEPAVTLKENNNPIPADEYTVAYSSNVNVGDATTTPAPTVTVTAKADGNYTFTATASFTIRKAGAVLTGSPLAKDLTYTGQPQELVTVGTATGGKLVYSLSENDPSDPYREKIPEGENAGTYIVYYKVQGDANHTDTTPSRVSVTIKPKRITPAITLTPTPPYVYNSGAHKPTVTVMDGAVTVAPSEYTVSYRDNINAGTATVTVSDANGGNYIVNGSTTFTIEKAPASVTTPPTGRKNLPYNGTEQELATTGATSDGNMVYALSENGEYSTAIPTGKDVANYTVWYKVLGDSNHTDSKPKKVDASIITNTVTNPTIRVTPESVEYDGKEQEPTVTVKDDQGFEISGDEYHVAYSGDMTSVGKYTLTITGVASGNYTFTQNNTAAFEILPAGQKPLTIMGTRDHVYYGDIIQLGTMGGNGTIAWKVDNDSIAKIDASSGKLEITGVGSVTVTATCTVPGYADQTATWPFYAEKKPVTAIVTAAAKTYDGKTKADVTATLQSSDLITGDSVQITLSGAFEDADAGTDKKVNIDSSNPIVDNTSKNAEKYAIKYPATATASIFKAKVDDTKVLLPGAVSGLEYTGLAQVLVTAGSSPDGTLEYSTDGVNYSASLPTGINADSYDVWYRVKGDRNHNDTVGTQMTTQVIIKPQEVPAPLIEFTPESAVYDGGVHKPKVTVKDKYDREIPKDDYEVTYDSTSDWKSAGNHKVTITGKTVGNYKIHTAEKDFTIMRMGQSPLSIVNQPGDVRYGDSFTLSTNGGSGTGAVSWKSSNTAAATVDTNGQVKVLKSGSSVTITATKAADVNYGELAASWTFSAGKKPVTPVVTAKSKPYDGTTNATLEAALKSGDLATVNGVKDVIKLTATGEFETADAGTNKRVIVKQHEAEGGNAGEYEIIWPDSVTASIDKVDAELDTKPKAIANLKYIGSPQELVTDGTTKGGIGTVVYSLSEKGEYSAEIPTATEIGKYTVWYKVADSVNYTGIPATSIEVEIATADPTTDPNLTVSVTQGQKLSNSILAGLKANVAGEFTWKDEDIEAVDGRKYDAIFTPADTEHYNTITVQVTVTIKAASSSSGGGGTSASSNPPAAGSPSMLTTVRNGTASTVVSAAAGNKLVQEAVKSRSQNIVIRPEITSDVTKTEVSIPASTVNQIKSETKAAITVASPVAGVTIPHAALDTLGRAGGTVNVAAEQAGQSVVLTLTANGRSVEAVPGGLTLTVPAKEASPGTVAVLVHDDGTRETLRKSVVENGEMSIPLSGSATVEIVDNSKDFTDVPAENWASDAVAFASARELFNGTSETTFSPDQSMSRGMLATVLYNLEGRPDQDTASGFGDVSSGDWYADGIAWAAENGIVNGYGDGQFGPNDDITREQFAVMLWKYAGSPKARNDQILAFTDADQVSGYAADALCWAIENGVLNGYPDGRLAPGGTATRAEAAQMLKNFMENV